VIFPPWFIIVSVDMNSFSWRWMAVAIFVLSSALNYLDRSLLNVLAPVILKEFQLNQLSFGYVISAFSIVYAVSSVAAGVLLDRIGLNKSISAAIAWWSGAGILTALTKGFGSLLLVRAALGMGESAGVPAFGKLNGIYLKPSERAMGAAVNQIGLALGGILAAAAVPLAVRFGWRIPFALCGVLGLIWIPLWWWTSRKIPPQYVASELPAGSERTIGKSLAIFGQRDLWVLMAANVLWMGGYSLWNNWLTLYLFHVQHVPLKQTAIYVWIPPFASYFGGFFGGWLSLWWMNRRTDAVVARRRAVWISAIAGLVTLALPFAANPWQATAIISASYFFILAGSVNIYALPIDIFGAQHAGMAIGGLTLAFGLLQTVISPIFGWLADRGLYSQVIWMVTIPLVLSAAMLMACSERREEARSTVVA
jgi:ACS family hexuronate transporter-like MFS transporter